MEHINIIIKIPDSKITSIMLVDRMLHLMLSFNRKAKWQLGMAHRQINRVAVNKEMGHQGGMK